MENDSLTYIKWYEDDEISIYFSGVPSVSVRYISPVTGIDETKSIKKYPFINKKDVGVKIIDYKKQKKYDFIIPKGYCFDGASIPRMFWRLIGANTDNMFLIPALVHDAICENHSHIDKDRQLSTKIFDKLLKVSNVGSFKRFLMKNSVAIYQTLLCDW